MHTGLEIGRLLMVGLSGPELTTDEKQILGQHKIGGVILGARNLVDPFQIRRLTDQLHALGDDGILVAVDQEGGRVSRLPPPFTRFPAASLLSQYGTELVRRIGVATAREMRAAGIDLDFAPVLDVASNSKNRLIADRAFSSDPNGVARSGSAMMQGLLDGGVIACGKHFPGHGDTDEDSHVTLPVVKAAEAVIRERELFPFRRAIRLEAPCLMTAHVVYDHLDPRNPATLSSTILKDVLRDDLGFTGVVFSDDLEMKAIGRPVDAAPLAIKAGVDVLLIAHDLELAVRVVNCLEETAGNDPALRRRVADSCLRVQKLKGAARQSLLEPSLGIIGCQEHRHLAQVTRSRQ